MCCCCPQGIQAIIYLWCRSGCSKNAVASALSFFPPEPPHYSIDKYDKDGNMLPAPEPIKTSIVRDDSSDDSENKSPIKMIMERHDNFREKAAVKRERDKNEPNDLTYKFVCSEHFDIPLPTEANNVELNTIKIKGGLMANVYRPLRNYKGVNKVILFSHGNATDIGGTHPIAVSLCKSTCCTVVTYDYSGYGHSGSFPSVTNTYRDIEALYDYCQTNLSAVKDEVQAEESSTNNTKPAPLKKGERSNVILYGQSVGSGPSCWLLSKLSRKRTPPAALILHCPFTSGIRLITNSQELPCFIKLLDVFDNVKNIQRAKCPVFILHGIKDEEVDIRHSLALQEAVPEDYKSEPWWVPNRGHNDITEGSAGMANYIAKVNEFLDTLA